MTEVAATTAQAVRRSSKLSNIGMVRHRLEWMKADD